VSYPFLPTHADDIKKWWCRVEEGEAMRRGDTRQYEGGCRPPDAYIFLRDNPHRILGCLVVLREVTAVEPEPPMTLRARLSLDGPLSKGNGVFCCSAFGGHAGSIS